jgi:3-oxoadipate enol-lactonase
MESIVMSGAPLSHEVMGAGHPVVLIHAESVDRRFWDYQMDVFADRFRVVRYDLRNHGRSPRCTGWYDADRDLLDLLDALDISAAHLVGAGLGGNIALDFALQHPPRVSALVLAGSTGLGGRVPGESEMRELFDGLAPMMEAFKNVQRGGDPAPFIDQLLASPASPRSAAGRELLRRMLRDNAHVFRPSPPTGPKPIEPPAIGRLGEIGVPTLVMAGERDLANAKQIADILEQGISGATKIIVAGAGSFPNLDDPDFFNDTVVRFLTASQPPPATAS